MCYSADQIPDPETDPEGYERWLDDLKPDERPELDEGGAA